MIQFFLSLYRRLLDKLIFFLKKFAFLFFCWYMRCLIKIPVYFYMIFFKNIDELAYLSIINTMRTYFSVRYKLMFFKESKKNLYFLNIFNRICMQHLTAIIIYDGDEDLLLPFIFNIIQKKKVYFFLNNLPSHIFLKSKEFISIYNELLEKYKEYIYSTKENLLPIEIYSREIYLKLKSEKKILDNIPIFVITIINDKNNHVGYVFKETKISEIFNTT